MLGNALGNAKALFFLCRSVGAGDQGATGKTCPCLFGGTAAVRVRLSAEMITSLGSDRSTHWPVHLPCDPGWDRDQETRSQQPCCTVVRPH